MMNIQPAGLSVTSKLDERPLHSAETGAAQASGRSTQSAGTSAAPPSREQVDVAVKQINESMRASSQSLEFSVDDDSKHTIVKIVDVSTREVVRQIPTKEALEIAKSLDKMMGLLISQKA